MQSFIQLVKNNSYTSSKMTDVNSKGFVKVKVAQSCPTLCDPMDYTVHGVLYARILEWLTFPFSRGSSQPRLQTQVSYIAGRFFTSWATREALKALSNTKINFQNHTTHQRQYLIIIFPENWVFVWKNSYSFRK